MQSDEKINISAKDVWNIMSIPLRWIVSACGGVSILTLVSLVVIMWRVYNILLNNQGRLEATLIVWVIVLVFLFFISLMVITMTLLVSLVKIKFDNKFFAQNIQEFNQSCESFSSYASTIEPLLNKIQSSSNDMSDVSSTALKVVEKINTLATQIHLSEFILDEREITELEASVSESYKIIVMTSQYKLDSGKLLQVILNNIRKGVIYEYLIPSEDGGDAFGEKHDDFCKVVCGWWKQFIKDYENHIRRFEQNGDIEYSKDYMQLVEKKLEIESDELKEFFLEHVREHIIANEYSLVTIIMYQKGSLTDHEWESIIKLPTVSSDNYYAFKIPDEETKEKRNLIEAIEKLCRHTNNVNLFIKKNKSKWSIGGSKDA